MRLDPYRAILVLGLAAAALTACAKSQPDSPSAPSGESPVKPVAVALPPQAIETAAPAPVPAPSASRDPAQVMISWAKAVSLKHWAEAYSYWGDHGQRSGQTAAQFAAVWSKLSQPEVELGKGEQEGAAGSLFYTAPVTIIDGQRRIAGVVVLRRVNDVDGASVEQLRWHIESTTLNP